LSKYLGNRLPEDVVKAFDGQNIEAKIGLAYLLVTTDEDGTPRPCMLSAGEILIPDDRHLRVALWPGTKTAANLSHGGRVLFCYVAPGVVVYAKGASRSIGPAPDSKLARFEVAVDTVESDVHQGMPVKETVLFEIEGMDTSQVVESWRRQLESLRS
jgi:hypothetical protein